MCGVAGFIDCSGGSVLQDNQARCRLTAMLSSIRHRGPDDWGMAFFGFRPEVLVGDNGHAKWLESPDVRMALGHRRLAILDLSVAGRQPMLSRDASCCITFNGEIYNYIELREELRNTVEFRTGTDTEVLLEAYRRWGIGMLKRLDGMFAFALWDNEAKKLVCARDPLGVKPFYFGHKDRCFFFASEPKAVLAGLNIPGHVDYMRVAEFLALGISDHDDGTSYQEVHQLPAGHWFEVDVGGVISEPRRYWKPPKEARDGDIETLGLLREQINGAVRRQLRSDVPVGSCLSGGLDSGSIVATVGTLLGTHATQFTALTLTDSEFDADESDLASSTARRAGVNWQKIEPKLEDIPIDIEEMVRTMDEPFPSLSMFAQRKIMQRARDLGFKVMLDGQGGDEVFLGYPRVAQRALGEQFRRGQIISALSEWRGLSRNGSQAMIDSFLANIFFSSPRIVLWRNKRRIAGLIENEFLEQARLEVAHQMYNSSQDTYRFQVGELTRFCLPQLLRFEDRNSMAYGVEARVPLLSIGLVEMGLGLPLHWKIRDGWTKYALRVAMKDRLPNEVVWCKRKRGFEIPQRRWVEALRPQIARWMEDLPVCCPIKAPRILALIDAHQGGEPWLWRCLSTALWMRFSGVRV